MKYLEEIRTAYNDPQALEELYRKARHEGKEDEFSSDLLQCYQESPQNVLYQAWYVRLQPAPAEERAAGKGSNWKLAIPLSLIAGLLLWWLSDQRFLVAHRTVNFYLAWAPIEAALVIAFLTLTTRSFKRAWPTLVLIALYIYAQAFGWPKGAQSQSSSLIQSQYFVLMTLHFPLLAWIGVGLSILGLRSDHANRFAFLAKSIEVFITAAIFAAVGGIFVGITWGLFAALRISLSEPISRLLIAGTGGAVPVLAVASVYDPHLAPVAQQFEQGLGKVISTAVRLLLPLTLLVLVVYLFVIPFNFMAPFRSRDILIVYNAMLFAIMALLIGVTPLREESLPTQYGGTLRTGILLLAILAVLVSVYALSATVYRTVQAGITPNRLTVIGWNSINISILMLLIYKQFKHGARQWMQSVQSAIGMGAMAYIAWTIFLIVALPLLFR